MNMVVDPFLRTRISPSCWILQSAYGLHQCLSIRVQSRRWRSRRFGYLLHQGTLCLQIHCLGTQSHFQHLSHRVLTQVDNHRRLWSLFQGWVFQCLWRQYRGVLGISSLFTHQWGLRFTWSDYFCSLVCVCDVGRQQTHDSSHHHRYNFYFRKTNT